MIPMNKFWLPLLALAALSMPAFAQQDDTVVEEIVARVNNSIITREDLRHGRDQMLRELHEQKPNATQADLDAREKDNLRDLIDQQLLIQKASDLGISADVETVKRLEELRLQMGAKDMDELQKLAEGEGVSWEEFKQNTKNGILTQKVISQEVGSRINTTRDEARKFYEEHKADLDQPESVRLSEILVASLPDQPKEQDTKVGTMAPQASPEQIAAARAKADELLAKLKSGTKFDELARQYSNGPTAQQGGDLGYFKRGMLAKEIEDQTFALKVGQNTDIIQTKQGFLILKLLDHTQAGLPPFEKVEQQIQEQLYMRHIQPELRTYLTKLREDAYVDIKPGFVDTGASANQTKLVYTNTPATPDKKAKTKKRHKRFLIF
jgi:peptidyl-prolyl cis-trans isomerase SurA